MQSSPTVLVASPLEEEDISRAAAFHEGASTAARDDWAEARRKQKQRAEDPFDNDSAESSSDEAQDGAESYPPRKDEEEETRRVEETLRRWEETERQRRKAARESASSTATSSLVGDVTRRASLLWSARRSKHASQGSGAHQVLRNADESVQLDDLDNTLTPSPTPQSENPFATPNASTISLNAPQHSTLMKESSDPSVSAVEGSGQRVLPASKPGSSVDSQPPSSTRKHKHPPPQPLDLPKPRTPPPRTSSPHATRPPEPILPPVVSHKDQEEEEERPQSRWWTDWLCGCKEKGDSQTGRTNPFE